MTTMAGGFGVAGQRGCPRYAGPYSTGIRMGSMLHFPESLDHSPIRSFAFALHWRLGGLPAFPLRGICGSFPDVQQLYYGKTLDFQGSVWWRHTV